MPKHGRLSCRRCYASYPSTDIVKCQTFLFGEVTLCPPCHKWFHPHCKQHVTVVKPEDKLCDSCTVRKAILACPMCTGFPYHVQLCVLCCTEIHRDLHESHLDHVYTVPA
ncbi:uncharacterized protein LOC127832397 [Dreissena polymorpha]|uniref:uncharacterized protein LOC127832397 n=1 Tax=Dreissena polymorpha TaxID=45954 RepID=UPI00226502AC|nr:uncharacterized protein LOC127832397 [Dreissena polymorpha]